MMTKTAYYMQMAQEAAAQITGSKEQWTAFLTTSARLYKYPFAEQLMIYKQRPEATACAEYDLWNDRMNRYVKRGTLDADLAEVMKKLAKDKMLRALSNVAYAKGVYEKEMDQAALKKEASAKIYKERDKHE